MEDNINPLVFHLVSGDAYFSGLLFVILSLWITNHNKFCKLSFLTFSIGLIFVCLTAVPTSLLEVIFLVASFSFSAVLLHRTIGSELQVQKSEKKQHLQRRFHLPVNYKILTCILISFLMVIELSWRASPKFNSKAPRRLIIFADSITAGIGENEAETWPNLLAKKHDVRIVDYSRMGATVGSQLKWIHARNIPEGLIFIELGGNDMLGASSVKNFQSDLDQLLEFLTRNSQPVVMFELPIPPTFNRFGIAQRELANKYRVQLISKKVFAQVLASQGATLDSLHLSQTGHSAMANAVWNEIQNAFE